MAHADQRPGRRRAVPEPKRRRERSSIRHRSGFTAGSGDGAPERGDAPASVPQVVEPPPPRDSTSPAEAVPSAPSERVTRPPASRSAARRDQSAARKRDRRAERREAQVERARQRAAAREERRRRRREQTRNAARLVLSAVWVVLTALGLAAILLGWVGEELPTWLPTAGAVTITTTYTWGLAARTGGRPYLSGGLALLATAGTVVTRAPVLIAAAAVTTAVVAAILGVMATTPAARFAGVVRECLVATAVTAVGAVAVQAYHPEVSAERVGYLTLGLSLLGAVGLVYRLGAGFHGLGRRGAIMVVGGLALLFVIIAYTEALARWGTPGLVTGVESALADVRSALGAVPRPAEVLVGFPALAWGVSTRARRRQGWWVSAFGAAGLATVAVSLLGPEVSLEEAGRGLLYSAALGLALGYLVIRVDTFLTGPRGRRARRLEEASAHRPEPGRMWPLL